MTAEPIVGLPRLPPRAPRQALFAYVDAAWRFEGFNDCTLAKLAEICAKIVEENGPGTAYYVWMPRMPRGAALPTPATKKAVKNKRDYL